MTSLRGDSFLPSSLLGAREWGDESMEEFLWRRRWVIGWGGASQTDVHQSPGGFVKAWIIPQEFLMLLVWGCSFRMFPGDAAGDHTSRTSGVVEGPGA